MHLIRLFSASILTLLFTVVAALAQDVTLTSRDGTLSIEGTLLGYDGEFYRVETVYGPLTLDGEGVICTGPGCPDLAAYVAEVRLSGTPHMANRLLPALLIAFAEQRGLKVERQVTDDISSSFVMRDDERIRARFDLRATTTREAYADLIAEEADIALVLREPRADEEAMAASSGAGNLVQGRRARVVALDGIVAVTAADQPIPAISLPDLTRAFSDPTPNWSAFGGPDLPVTLHIPLHGSGLAEAFSDLLFGKDRVDFSPVATAHSSLETIVDLVADDPFALGLTTLSEVGNVAPLPISGACGYTQDATIAALRTEDYPLTLPLMLFTPARRLPLLAREFLEFTETQRADLVARRLGFVDQAITQSDFNDQGNRLAHAISAAGEEVTLADLQALTATLQGRTRLSTTFRFEDGSTRLDVPSRESAARLARALETGTFNGSDMLFVGFSDSAGAATGNEALSKRRARTVLTQVRDLALTANFDDIIMDTTGFGEVLPIACDDTDWGRAVNRRVEVWVK